MVTLASNEAGPDEGRRLNPSVLFIRIERDTRTHAHTYTRTYSRASKHTDMNCSAAPMRD